MSNSQSTNKIFWLNMYHDVYRARRRTPRVINHRIEKDEDGEERKHPSHYLQCEGESIRYVVDYLRRLEIKEENFTS